ncbi:hypothetical protein SSP0854 [Staphylococcus saprophyticus subsp. saprophyticus ATCC 15305]|uniref:Uncharacterized protein n=1 Tax=Staphylococcus saprophyticus subsp. saprophyticus (strain ATCC 15305 / DSM 20229 / NCIMB 8711 / NCTC 7292 / S-41) TaxID=342451 RepID=Q49YX9_STAS1|nr:hypothetical protein SSP0854 [Staphylococcus saprophyticus subsp. saprophyticus ATCC 15305] [Staphylococcus saprophyticus subsp. saprophyticus ATCC 15305 = NCTC 7292]
MCKATYLSFHLFSNQTRKTTSKLPVNKVVIISCHHEIILHLPQKKVPCRNSMAYPHSNTKQNVCSYKCIDFLNFNLI